MSKKPFIERKSRPAINMDTRLSDLTVNDLVEFFGGSRLGKAQPEKVRLELEHFKEIIPEIIKNWKEYALEIDPWGAKYIRVLDSISKELSTIKEQLNIRR